jgi:hypothetical protein
VPIGVLGIYVKDRFRFSEGPVNVSYKRHPVSSIRTPEEMLSNIHTIK